MKLARSIVISMMLTLTAVSAGAEDDGTAMPGHSPYAGLEKRSVKALSDQDLADLRAGRGMGLALTAELNGYPGPRHVLDLADQLQLTARQRAKTQGLFNAMKAETIPIGGRIMADEMTLDRLFADHRITPETLHDLTARIGAAQGELRAAHLRYHLSMMKVLSPAQVAHYVALRGYGAGSHPTETMH
ncbi:MAG TPA: periplasmic heavy metal sensor [Dongiaceae bacterium]|nr:periplasmic heavy metal sensor [Dongiaceae bacterium]